MDAITEDLPLPIAVISLVEHWKGPMQRGDFATDCGEIGQLALKAGLIGHPTVGYADLTPTGRMIRWQTVRLREVQADGEHVVAPIPEGVLRVIARFTDAGFLDGRSADTKAHLDLAVALDLVAKTWPPNRLALTPKGQVVRQAALWTAPVESDDEDEDTDIAIEAEPAEPTVPVTGRPLSIFGAAAPIRHIERPAPELVGRPKGKRPGRPPGTKYQPRQTREPIAAAVETPVSPPPPPASPISVRGPDAVEANIAKTSRTRAARAETPDVVDQAKADAERKRKRAADIRRWTSPKR